MPPAIFVAVPELTQLPATTHTFSPGLLSALVNSGVVPRLVGLPQPVSQQRHQVSSDVEVTDTSFCDYEIRDVG